MISTKKNIRKDRGFTLVELLVVIGIIAALAAVVIPNVSRFVGSGEAEANNTERQTMQAAIDLLMADNALITVAPSTAPLGTFAAFDFDAGAGTVTLYAPTGTTYLRQNPTKCSYEWVASGQIATQTLC